MPKGALPSVSLLSLSLLWSLFLLAIGGPAGASPAGVFSAPPAGDVHFRGPVSTFSALPSCTRDGDFRVTLDTYQSYVCSVGVWHSGGSTGTPGSQIYNGSGAPSSGLGVVGDYYLRVSNGDLYAKSGSGAGTWAVLVNLKGATGATGATGASGTNGMNGSTGPQGPAGPSSWTPLGMLWPGSSRTVYVDAAGRGDFTTINDATAYVALQLPTNFDPWRIVVEFAAPPVDGFAPYIQERITVPPYTSLVGVNPGPRAGLGTFNGNVVIQLTGTNGELVTLGAGSNLVDLDFLIYQTSTTDDLSIIAMHPSDGQGVADLSGVGVSVIGCSDDHEIDGLNIASGGLYAYNVGVSFDGQDSAINARNLVNRSAIGASLYDGRYIPGAGQTHLMVNLGAGPVKFFGQVRMDAGASTCDLCNLGSGPMETYGGTTYELSVGTITHEGDIYREQLGPVCPTGTKMLQWVNGVTTCIDPPSGGGGGGGVIGPSSSVADQIATYSDTTGSVLKASPSSTLDSSGFHLIGNFGFYFGGGMYIQAITPPDGRFYRVSGSFRFTEAGDSIGSDSTLTFDNGGSRIDASSPIVFRPHICETCNSGYEGAICYSSASHTFCGCNGTSWAPIIGPGPC